VHLKALAKLMFNTDMILDKEATTAYLLFQITTFPPLKRQQEMYALHCSMFEFATRRLISLT